MEEAADGDVSGDFCGWRHNFVDPAVSGGLERIVVGCLFTAHCRLLSPFVAAVDGKARLQGPEGAQSEARIKQRSMHEQGT